MLSKVRRRGGSRTAAGPARPVRPRAHGGRRRRSRPLKRHVQLDLLEKPKRKAAKGKRLGRPPKNGFRAGSPHTKRPAHEAKHPVHVVLRALQVIGSLRTREIYQAMRWATITAAKREGFRIVHLSIQRTHVHLLVEAANKQAIARGMQGFQISAAKLINAAISKKRDERRRGTVFPDRYHQEVITTPRQARHALAYVLNNWRKHREDQGARSKAWMVDPFSTGVLFSGWQELADKDVMWKWRETYQPMIVWFPKTWLLSEGWRRYGLIGTREVPSANRSVRAA